MNNELMIVHNSKPLKGSVSVDGAKNSVLVLMATTLLVDGTFIFSNVPILEDVLVMAQLLRHIGSKVIFDTKKKQLTITTIINTSLIPDVLLNKMRASILVLAPLLARTGHASFSQPGGCNLGKRPLDYHIKALEKLNVSFFYSDIIQASVEQFKPNKIILDYPSVGATETALLAAVNIKNKTTIINASLEPEVTELVNFLNLMGAKITYDLPATIIIDGGYELKSIDHVIMPDRLEAGSLILAALATKGEINLTNVRPDHLDLFLEKISEMGHFIEIGDNFITCKYSFNSKAVSIRTAPYPGFPTDLLAPMMALLCITNGESFIEEGVFDDRLGHVTYLKSLGANIDLKSNTNAVINGVESLVCNNVKATNIRAACALVIAGLAATGITVIDNVFHWHRGYGEMLEKLQKLGANIYLTNKSEFILNQVQKNI